MTAAQIYRRQEFLIHAPIWVVAVIVFFLLSMRWIPMPPQEITISAGRPGGMYQEHAARYVTFLAQHGIKATVMESAGTGENLQRLKDPAAQVHMGFVQGGYAVSESSQSMGADIETIAQVDIEPVWVFSRFKDVDSLLRLQGTRVAIGQAGSGSRAVAVRMFEQVRLEPKDLVLSESVGMEMVTALREGRIDAMIFVASPTAPVVQALLKSPGIQMASLRRSAAMIERLPYLDARFVAAGSLQATTQQPPQDTALLTTYASVVVREDLHPMVKRVLASAALQIHGGAGPLHASGEFPHLKRLEFPSSTHARSVLRDGLPWLEEQLGVRWAQWVYRLLLIGLPLAFIAYVLGRLLPAYLRWLMESNINRWYGELKYIENDLKVSQPGGLELARFRGKLRDIEVQVNKFQAPRSFHQRMYVLQQHVKFVNAQLKGSHGR
jgi:uncharacterized protein